MFTNYVTWLNLTALPDNLGRAKSTFFLSASPKKVPWKGIPMITWICCISWYQYAFDRPTAPVEILSCRGQCQGATSICRVPYAINHLVVWTFRAFGQALLSGQGSIHIKNANASIWLGCWCCWCRCRHLILTELDATEFLDLSLSSR